MTGSGLAASLQEQAIDAGAQVKLQEATGIESDGPYKSVATTADAYTAKAVIIAMGSSLKSLGIPGEEKLFGSGVSHCATCDGPLFMGETVCVVGGGDSAADEALTLTEYADHVVVFHRGESLDAQKALQDRLTSNRRVEVILNTHVESIAGDKTVIGVDVRHKGHQICPEGQFDGSVHLRGIGAQLQHLPRVIEAGFSRPHPGKPWHGNGCSWRICSRRYPATFGIPAGKFSRRWRNRRHRCLPLHLRPAVAQEIAPMDIRVPFCGSAARRMV